MDACVAALQGIEMDASQIHVERFASLPDEEDAAGTPAAELPPAEGVDEAEVEIAHQGQVHRLRCGGSETILDAAMRSASSCRIPAAPGFARRACARCRKGVCTCRPTKCSTRRTWPRAGRWPAGRYRPAPPVRGDSRNRPGR